MSTLGLKASVVSFLCGMVPGTVAVSTGLPQTHKSMYWQAAYAAGAFPRCVVFDRYARRDRMREAGGELVSPWGGTLVHPNDLIRRPDWLCYDPLYLVVAPDDAASEEEVGRQFTAVARLCWKVGGITLIAEEMGTYARQASEAINLWASGAGHIGGKLCGICQRFGRIQIDARHLIRRLVVHPTAGAELKHIRELCGDAFAAQVARLRPPSEDGSFPGDPPLTWAIGQPQQEELAS